MARTRTLAFCLLALPLAACGTKDTGTDPTPNPNPNPVDAKLTSLSITTANTSVAIDERLTLTVEGLYDDQTKKDHTADVTWTSSDEAVIALVADTAGAFDAVAEGRATLTATLDAVSTSVDMVVAPPSITALEIIPNSADLGMGAALVVTVLATLSDGSRETVTDDVTWGSDDEFVLRASASDAGRLVTFGNEGSATITARLGSVEATGTYTVGAARIAYVSLEPRQQRIGDVPLQFTANAYWTDERRTDVTTIVDWTSSEPGIVMIDANGLATRVTDGEVVITASAPTGDASGSAILRTIGASVCGDYPTDHSNGIAYNQVVAPMFWLDAINEVGENVDFRMEDLPCDTENFQSILFVIGAGWCPYCPAFKQRIDGMQAQLEAAGMRVVYVETETDAGAPATNVQANQIINRTLSASTNSSIRMGDGEAAGAVDRPFARAVQYLPNALVVRTSDMQVIAAGQSHDFLNVAQNPEMTHGSN